MRVVVVIWGVISGYRTTMPIEVLFVGWRARNVFVVFFANFVEVLIKSSNLNEGGFIFVF